MKETPERTVKPTAELYDSLQIAYDHFNQALFDSSLPQVIFTTQRQQFVMGYFAPDRWTSKNGSFCHEIAINPSYVGHSSMIELLQTLVHEMAHCWQHCNGKPGRRGYHNKQWAMKMEKIGLMPSSTGAPGGRTTGEHMQDYPIKGGAFIQECKTLISSSKFDLPWVDRQARPEQIIDDTFDGYSDVLMSVEEEIRDRLTVKLSHVLGEEVFFPIQAMAAKKKQSTLHLYGLLYKCMGKTRPKYLLWRL